MKCPQCGYNMGNHAKCLRCGYAVTSIVPVDPDKIEQEEPKEENTTHRVVDPDDVYMSRGGGRHVFGDLFGGGIFGGFGSLFGDLFGVDLFGDDSDTGYEYDPKYYDDFGNEIDLPDEFERDSVEISDVEYLEEPSDKDTKQSAQSSAEDYNTNKSRKHKHKLRRDRH